MKKIIIIFSLLFIFAFSLADTHIPAGNVSGVWTFNNSPYIIDGEISIQQEDELTIVPGIQVIFSGHYKFNIYGRIFAEGTATDSIVFLAQDAEIGWKGLRFIDTSANDQDSSKVVYCKFENGNATSGSSSDRQGGAIACYHSSDVLINYCLFQNNTANYGGAIAICDSDIILQNSVVKNNYANYYAGGIRINNSEVILENVILTNNSAGNKGGGIYCYDSNPTMSGVSIFENSSNSYGGGLYLNASYPVFDNENRCNIYQNDSDVFGKDIYSVGAVIDVIVDTFTVLIPDNYFAYPMNNYTFDILNSAIEQVDQDLYVSPTGSDENSGLTADDPLKTINFAMYMMLSNEENPHTIHLAEGVYSLSDTGENFPIYMKKFISIIGENSETTVLNGENLTRLIISVFPNNNFSLQGVTITNGIADYANGGGIYCKNSDITIVEVIIENNHATLGGGIYFYCGTLTLSNIIVTNNSASNRITGSGGGIYCNGSANFTNVLINENYAFGSGGGIWCTGSNDEQFFSNISVIGNTVGWYGGGIAFNNCEPELSSITVTENYSQYGGGICFADSEPIFDSENRCSIYSNTTSSDYSKDIYSDQNSITVIVDTFTVSNPTDYYAAPICNITFDILHSISDNLINSDFYVSVTGDDSNTGTTANEPLKTIRCALSKIYADSLNQNTIYLSPGIYGSETTGETFPIIWYNYVSLEGSAEEEAILDGNNEMGGLIFYYISDAVIKNITIRNFNGGYGGGIYCCSFSNPSLENITLTNNHSSYGGGIYCRFSSNPILTNVTITNNHSSRGGGICCSYSSNPILTNVIITDNTSAYNGGGIHCSYSSNPILTNVTVADNYTDDNGGGIYCSYSSSTSLFNCILWNNLPQEVYFYEYTGLNEITISYSDIQGGENGIVTNNNGTVNWLEGNIDEDPLFVGTGEHPYSLMEDSPCIDAGTAFFEWQSNILLDMSQDEYIGDAPDMGAYEFDSSASDENLANLTNKLFQNYPNPFNPTTTIYFTAESVENAEIIIYNIKGQRIKQFSIDNCQFSIQWNGTDDSGKSVGSGIYFYQLKVDDKTIDTKKCLLLR